MKQDGLQTINGGTRLVGIVADPISHVRTPAALNALFAIRGINAVCVPLHVPAADLARVVPELTRVRNMAGIVVTIPHKESIVALCDELTGAARRTGAANVVRFPHDGTVRLHGTNLDGEGFVNGLLARGHDVAGRHVYLAGAGGAGKAIAHAIAEAGAAVLGIYNRNASRAEQLVEQLRGHFPHVDIYLATDTPSRCTLAINATSLGLAAGDGLPFRIEALPSEAVVAEAVMKSEPTQLLAAATRRGLAVHEGRYMMEHQIEGIGRFLGVL